MKVKELRHLLEQRDDEDAINFSIAYREEKYPLLRVFVSELLDCQENFEHDYTIIAVGYSNEDYEEDE